MAVYYDSAAVYIQTATDLCDKINKIDEVINALIDNALVAAGKNNIEEYSLNDGQTVIRTKYRSAADVQESINGFEKIKQMYVNRLNGRVVRLQDGKSMTRNRYGY